LLDSSDLTHLDGRLARSQRTRSAIVDALIALLEAGNVQPTVEDIAAHAGVAPRTVFQHYPDREALFRAVSERRQPQVDALMGSVSSEGPVEARVDALVEQRVRLYEWIGPVRRAALLMEPFSENVHAALDGARAVKRAEAVRVFAKEIAAVPGACDRAALQSAIAAAVSFSAWDVLRTQQGLDVEASRAALRTSLAALLRCS
jgi:TetR/AcrR family transcriptional regulator of autoinduction and epiphytic fitness